MKLNAWVLLGILAMAVSAAGNPVNDVPFESFYSLDPEQLCNWTKLTETPATLTWDEHEFTGIISFEMKMDTLFVNETPVPILVGPELTKSDLATPADLLAYADYVGKDLETWIEAYRESPLVDSLRAAGDTLHVLFDNGEGFLPTWQVTRYREGLWSLRCRDVRSTVIAISERLEDGHPVSVIDGAVQLGGASP
jgi:hypothetical protein